MQAVFLQSWHKGQADTLVKAIGPEGSMFRSEGMKLVGVLHQGGATNNATRIAVSFDGSFQTL